MSSKRKQVPSRTLAAFGFLPKARRSEDSESVGFSTIESDQAAQVVPDVEPPVTVTPIATPTATPTFPVPKQDIETLFDFTEAVVHCYYNCHAKCDELKSASNYKEKFLHKWIFDKSLSFCETTGVWWLAYLEYQSSGENLKDVSGMYCILCRKHDSENSRNHSKVYNLTPAKRFKKSAVQDHSSSQQHKAAVVSEMYSRVSTFHKQVEDRERVKDEVLLSAFYSVYWLAKEEVASVKVFSLIKLLQEVGLEKMKFFTYTSRDTLRQILINIGDTLLNTTLLKLKGSYGILIDEVTDMAATMELLVTFIQYVNHDTGKTETDFLSVDNLLSDSNSADAQTITSVLLNKLKSLGISVDHMASLCSDGASVMTGKVSGVAARLKQINSKLISCHCICHKLALACNDSAAEVTQVKRVLEITTEIWIRFEKSPKRTATLMKAQMSMKKLVIENSKSRQILQTKLKKCCKTRWLSQSASVLGLRDDFVPVLHALKTLEDEDTDVKAAGLLKYIRKPAFIGTLYILCEILPILADLSRTFQKGNICFSQVKPAIEYALARIDGVSGYSPGTPVDRMVRDLEPGGHLQMSDMEPLTDFQYRDLTNLMRNYCNSVKTNIHSRFDSALPVINAFSIFDPVKSPQDKDADFDIYGNEHIRTLAEHFFQNLPEPQKEQEKCKLQVEWEHFRHTLVQMKSAIPDHIRSAKNPGATTQWALEHLMQMKSHFGHFYPLLVEIAQICLTLAMSNAWPERGASALKRIKTRLRNRMKTDALNALLLISINGPQIGTASCQRLMEESVHQFMKQKNRRKVKLNYASVRQSQQTSDTLESHSTPESSISCMSDSLSDEMIRDEVNAAADILGLVSSNAECDDDSNPDSESDFEF